MSARLYILIPFAFACSPVWAEHRPVENDFEDRLPASALEVVRRGRGADEGGAAPAAGGGAEKKEDGSDKKDEAEKEKSEKEKAEEKSKADTAKVDQLKTKEGTPSADDVKDLNKFIDELSKAPKDEFTDQRNQQIQDLIALRSNWFDRQTQAEMAANPAPATGSNPSVPAPVGNAAPPTPATTQAQAAAIINLAPPPAPPPPPPATAPPPAPAVPNNSVASQSQAIFAAPPAPLAPISKPAPASANNTTTNSSSGNNGPVSNGPENLPIFRSSTGTGGSVVSPVFSQALPAAPPAVPVAPPPPPPAAPSAPVEPSTPLIATAPPPPPPAPEPMPFAPAAPMNIVAAPPPPFFPTASSAPAAPAEERAALPLPLPSNAQSSYSPIPAEPTGTKPAAPSAEIARGNESQTGERTNRPDPVIAPQPEPPPPANPERREMVAAILGGYNLPDDLGGSQPNNASSISVVDPGKPQTTPMPSLTISASPTKPQESPAALLLTDLRAFGQAVVQATLEKSKKTSTRVEAKFSDLTSFMNANTPRR